MNRTEPNRVMGALVTALLSVQMVGPSCAAAVIEPGGRAGLPVIYCTDLFHPHVDPDDHFDLATLYALPELDVRGIVLDQGQKQLQRPGRIPVSQLNHLTGRTVPAAIGLATPLKSPSDAGLDQPTQFQAGVAFILDTLRQCDRPVALIAVGSVRDVLAAFNREPDLLRRKVSRVLCFIGEATREDFQEYNVGLDPQAFVGLMRSGLPVDWVPCFDGGLWQNRGHASFWKTKHEDLLRRAPPELVQFFIYALEHEKADPLAFLHQPVDAARKAKLFAGERNLWCTAIFGSVAGRLVVQDGRDFLLTAAGPASSAGKPAGALYGFEECEVRVTDAGVVKYASGPGAVKVRRFVVQDRARFAEGMTRATADLLAQFPVRRSNP
jgi:hypothetical protein